MPKPKRTPATSAIVAPAAGNRRQAFAQIGIYLAVVLGWLWGLLDQYVFGGGAPMSNEVAIAIAGLLQYAFYAATREDELVPPRAAAEPEPIEPPPATVEGLRQAQRERAAEERAAEPPAERFARIQAGAGAASEGEVDDPAGGRLG